ncbi:MAG TPA: TetR/AcrR family transcriptional regulator [Tessaracoccus flavescens]|uniref:TetR/AcrR family transcriptional regulator n=1 Tax=Tessaracoccus flavescens TaxID=399497 RepID=A0A921ER75_9ACTN|nr:TetR/AcrR family transcriptional regulator [Tessaracoccus flavescens]
MGEVTTRRSETLAKLSAAAVREFARNGIDATSIEKLCDAAGFTRGAFYSNFSSKDDFLLAMMRQISDQRIANFEGAMASLPEHIDPTEIIPGLLRSHTITHEESMVQQELQLRAERDPEFFAAVGEYQKEAWEVYKNFALTALERAKVVPLVDIDDFLHILQSLYEYPDDREPASPGRTIRAVQSVAAALTRYDG